jgi:hypothetical protein
MLALAGPGWLAIAAGLAMLAGDFQWARRLLDGVKTIPRRIDERESRRLACRGNG